jgi:uncharacterized membrane protein YqaE (UPF0057 family)
MNLGKVWPVAAGLSIAVPPLAGVLESTMTTHMLLQIPLLAACGWFLGEHLARRYPVALGTLSMFRWALLILAAGTLAVWMIPRLLDLAVQSAGVDFAKVTSLALLGGLPLRIAWFHLGPVARGIVHVEALASLWRVGWIYVDSPSRLCTQYGLEDQQRLGALLLQAGAMYAVWLAWQALGLPTARQLTRPE